jgi:hypothetical protein
MPPEPRRGSYAREGRREDHMEASTGQRHVALAVMAVALLTLALPARATSFYRMVGGGSIDNPDLRVTLGTDLPCTATNPGAELQISWFNPQPDPPGRESFHMSTMTFAECEIVVPDRREGRHHGRGMGTCVSAGQRVPASVEWDLFDGGIDNPGDRETDRGRVVITSALPSCNLTASWGDLKGGNLHFVHDSDL